MSQFGETLVRGGWFIRLTLSPFILLFIVLMPVVIDEWTPIRIAIIAVTELMCVSILVGLWCKPGLAHWAFRLLTGLVFLCYTAYLFHEFFMSDTPFDPGESRSNASPKNALLGFVVIGLPSLWFTLFGRFTIKPPSRSSDDEDKY